MSFRSQSTADLMKDGSKHLSGLGESIIRNIEASKKLAQITRTSLGPNGRNKMVINHIGKLFVTSDAATILSELQVIHPAAKMIVLASHMQEKEIGDGSNTVIVMAGELLQQAEALIRMGLHPRDIVDGYIKAADLAKKEFEALVTKKCEKITDVDELASLITPAIASKQYGYHKILAKEVAKACIGILPKNPVNFSVDNVRVVKILGGSVFDTKYLKGFVLPRNVEGTVSSVEEARVCVFVAGVDFNHPEAKKKVVLETAKELLEFTPGEEKVMEEIIQGISDAGVKVVVAGNAFSDVAMHYLERHGIMAVRVPSKFQLRRICRTTGATPLVRLEIPKKDDLGFCDAVYVEELGSTKVTVFRQDKTEASNVATLVVRGSTQNLMDDIERAIDDGVNVVKAITKDNRFIPGAGSSEIEVSRKLQEAADANPALEQYAIKKYAESLEVIPRTLAENAGMDSFATISNLYSGHAAGKATLGIGIETGKLVEMKEHDTYDHLFTKLNALRLATDAAVTILRVDEIIMAKRAGGPRPPKMGSRDS